MTQPPADEPAPQGDDAGGARKAGREHVVRHQPVSARVPEAVARGVFSTGAIVLQGADEFVLDFVLRLAHPHQVVARIVLPPGVMPRFIAALRDNLGMYQQTFGEPPRLPQPVRPPEAASAQAPPTIEQLYEELKLGDDVLSGDYANAVMIGHSASEFCFDFITNFYPRSAVARRVYLSAGQVPGFLEALQQSYFKSQQRPPPPPPAVPPAN